MSQNKKYTKNKQVDTNISDEALAIAQGIKQENQTKSQTKLIAQGIRKGIELYKNQQNKKQRDRDKRNKKELKNKLNDRDSDKFDPNQQLKSTSSLLTWLPWALLALSWLFFALYFYTIA